MARLFVVDGDGETRAGLCAALEGAGHAVRAFELGHAALTAARADRPDAVLAEVAFPDLGSFDLVRELGRDPTTVAARVIIVSDRSAEVDRVVAFELGAFDYVTKPFSTRELLLRVAAVLRGTETSRRERRGRLTIDRQAARIWVDGRELRLTKIERDLLLDLVDAGGRVRTREELVRHAIGVGGSSPRAIDSHVKRLRAKLGDAASVVDTVKGVGYRITIPKDGDDDG